MSFLPILIIFGIFYFLLIRPQQKKAKEHERMLQNLKKGDQVLTNGGIYGVVAAFKGQDVELKVAEQVKIQVARSAISQLRSPEDPSQNSH
ncbi:MAG: preprotein translocase subunit YajC [Elusimicrobia bacterium]|nr:preprotein translocase subunit YajC [Elusimicrobiota bacterium]